MTATTHPRRFDNARPELRREAEVVDGITADEIRALELTSVLDAPSLAETDERPDQLLAGARLILERVSFREDTGAFSPRGLVTTLARIAELDRDSAALGRYDVRHVVAATAKAALKGYSIDRSTSGRVLELLEDYARVTKVRPVGDRGALVIGTVTLEHPVTITRTPGESPRWTEDVELPAQTVDLVLWRSSSLGTDDTIGASFAGTSVRRESGATFGGVVVASSEETTPRETVHNVTARTYVAAREIAESGYVLGGRVVLAQGVELVARRYAEHVSPRSLRWEVRVDGHPAPAKR